MKKKFKVDFFKRISPEEMLEKVEDDISAFKDMIPTEDYLDTLEKKHKKTIKKGAMGTFEYFGGNPKKNAEIFNHMMDINDGSTNTTQTDTNANIGGDGAVSSTTGGE